MLLNDRIQSRLIYAVILVSSLALLRCTSSKVKEAEPKEPVAAAQTAAKSQEESNLPPELRDAEHFDPAATLDDSQVKESDFYKVRQEVDSKKATLDQEWKAQDQQEDDVRKAKMNDDLRQKAEQRQEEETRERNRQDSIKNYNANAKKRAHDDRIARQKAAKLPTISKEEVMWNGLED